MFNKNITTNLISLTRLDKPTGTLLLLFPCLWGVGFASTNIWAHWREMLLFTLGAFIMRSAGCVINDILDRKFDSQVERTKNRPLASGTIALELALLVFSSLCILGFFILIQFSFNSILIGLLFFPLVLLYPLAKRYIAIPQIVLALVFNCGALIAWQEIAGGLDIKAFMLYLACFFWTMGYDTIYAHQDKIDDKKIGVKSAALYFADKTKLAVFIFYFLMVLLLLFIAILESRGWLFYINISLLAIDLFWQVRSVDLDNPADCMKKFKGNILVGVWVLVAMS
ncbi:MAG TPA: 4-hydroxybenzoate octaprenyltransferase [Alphaproteobacteria bacterium]|nr:4-hydroxybenzoate octaprenyltransferase [Alphaproteobacteria bacterium]